MNILQIIQKNLNKSIEEVAPNYKVSPKHLITCLTTSNVTSIDNIDDFKNEIMVLSMNFVSSVNAPHLCIDILVKAISLES